MTGEDLEKPLTPAKRKTRRGPKFDGVIAIAVGVGLALSVFGLWALLVRDPLGGEPVVTAAIERRAPPMAGGENAGPTSHGPATAATGHDQPSRDGIPIVRPGDAMPKTGPVIIQIPGHGEAPNAPVTTGSPSGDIQTALLEDSRYGALPKIGADGRRPLDAYAAGAAPATGARVALIVSGLGVGREITQAAIQSLPAAVTLAFSPYGADVGDLIAKARGDGHETLIQAPMEPFGYPGNDTGPQTMLTSLPASANIDRLRWALARAKGYVGVAPLGGGKFLETEGATGPVFTELARRGLMFAAPSASDGDAGFLAVAERSGLARAPAAVQIDAAADPASIDTALANLETAAKSGGAIAVGWASATPLSLKQIEKWRGGLAQRGVTLTPVSATLRPQGPS